MVTTLVATYFPLERRARAMGLIMAGAALLSVIGAPIIGFIEGLWGWRIAFLGFVLPISLLSLLLAMKGLPSAVGGQQVGLRKGRYFAGFKAVLSNGSAVACLLAEVLRVSGFIVFYIYGASFLRQRFMMSTVFASTVMLISALCYTGGSIVSGRLVASFGRKPVTVTAILISGVFTISFTLSTSLWLALMFNLMGCFFAGINSSAAQSLNLEQVAEFRGAMMSMSTAAMNLGEAIGAGIGGLALLLFGYEVLSISLGAMVIAAAIIYHTLTTDPTRI
jgi:DHA1 family inner membrane transport protein